jgi:hypothetical protein
MVFIIKIEGQLERLKAIGKDRMSALGRVLIIARSIGISLSPGPGRILLLVGNWRLGRRAIGMSIGLSMIGTCRLMSLPGIEIMILSSTLTIRITKKSLFTPLGTHLLKGKIPETQ